MVEDLPNYLFGQRRTSSHQQEVYDREGRPRARIHSASAADLRAVKRQIHEKGRALAAIPLDARVRLVRAAMDDYLASASQRADVAALMDLPVADIERSLEARRAHANDLAAHHRRATGIPALGGRLAVGPTRWRAFLPGGPMVAVLPRNSDEESFFLITDAILAGVPALLKTSSSGPTSYSALALLDALERAAKRMERPDLLAVPHAFAVVNVFAKDDRAALAERIAISHATYVLFGTSATTAALAAELRPSAPRAILEYGTGYAMAVVHKDADLDAAADELVRGIAFHGGKECITTKVVYAHADVHDALVERMRRCARDLRIGKTSEDDADLLLPRHEEAAVLERMVRGAAQPGEAERALETFPHIVPLDPSCVWPEIGSAIAGVRAFSDGRELEALIDRDHRTNGLRRSVALATFGPGHLPPLLARTAALVVGQGTHRVPWDRHEGRSLLEQLLDAREVLEGPG